MVVALISCCVCASAVAAAPVSDRFDLLRMEDVRVASVAYRLAVANALRCATNATPQAGIVLHGLDQYRSSDREAAARRFNFGQHVAVMGVVSGSPADKAGVTAGDQVLAINEHRLDAPVPGGGFGQASIDLVRAKLVEAMRHGAVSLTVSSASGTREVRFTADFGCPSDVELYNGTDINAWADGSRVMIGEGLLRRCATDDDLALVIAHEMAHNLLHHRRRLAAEGGSANGLLPLSATASRAVLATEEEADRVAVVLANTAHFDLSGMAQFIGELTNSGVPAGATHPISSRRVALLKAAIVDAGRAAAPVEFKD